LSQDEKLQVCVDLAEALYHLHGYSTTYDKFEVRCFRIHLLYSVFQLFRQAKFALGGSILSMSQFFATASLESEKHLLF
jgi:hypothetical protein